MNKHYDLAVIGAGIAGTCCALAAARKGISVALIEPQEYLGGNASPMLEVTPEGAMAMGFNRFADETGIVEEIRSLWYRHNKISCGLLSETLWELVSKEKNIDLYIYSKAIHAALVDNQITEVDIQHLKTHEITKISVGFVADCSGDGDVAAGAGAEYMLGREGRSEFSESMAPEKADNGIMGATIKFSTRELPWKVKFTPPEEAYRFPDDSFLPHRPHEKVRGLTWWIEYATADNVFNQDELYKEHLKILFGFWDHMKNKGDHDCDNYMIDFISPYVARRESRRFKGAHVLTQNDVEEGVCSDDGIAFGGWPIDIHPPCGIFSKEKPAVQKFVDIYNIPFRSIYSKNIKNLFFAGRNISISHIALGTTRVEWTCGVIGQAAGTAAAFCAKKKILPENISSEYIGELQQILLKDDCFIIGAKNKDAADKGLMSRISASSSSPLFVISQEGTEAIDGRKICQTLPLSTGTLDMLSLYIENRSGKKAKGILKVFKCGYTGQKIFAQDEVMAGKEISLAEGFKGWADFDVNIRNTGKQPCWWEFETDSDLTIGYSGKEIPGCTRGIFDSSKDKFVKNMGYHDDIQALWIQEIRTYCFRTSPMQFPFGPENVVNGIARPYIAPNLWISDPVEKLPQFLTLELGKKIKINEIHLAFNTGLNRTWPHKFDIPECVKDYSISYMNEGKWKILSEVKDNFMRKRIHEAGIETDAIKITVTATHGAPSAQIFEVRVY